MIKYLIKCLIKSHEDCLIKDNKNCLIKSHKFLKRVNNVIE